MAHADPGRAGVSAPFFAARPAPGICAGALLRLAVGGGQKPLATHSGIAGLATADADRDAPTPTALSPLRRSLVLAGHFGQGTAVSPLARNLDGVCARSEIRGRVAGRCCRGGKNEVVFRGRYSIQTDGRLTGR